MTVDDCQCQLVVMGSDCVQFNAFSVVCVVYLLCAVNHCQSVVSAMNINCAVTASVSGVS